MYKREREIHEDFIEMDHAKRTKKEPLYALAESIENMMGASGNDYKNKVEWNNIHEDTNFESEIGINFNRIATFSSFSCFTAFSSN